MQHLIARKQANSHFCFACGLKNQFGLKARFYETTTNQLVGIFQPAAEHQGYPGRLHGGLISTILDEVMARAIMIGTGEAAWGVTAELNVRFKKPIPLDQPCRVIGRITVDKGRLYEATGEIVLDSGEVAATATGRYFKLKLHQIGEIDTTSLDWRVVPEPEDPTAIDFGPLL